MKRMKWRGLALGLVTATLGLGIAACDDDTTNSSPDLAMNVDMAVEVDMVMGTPGTGQIVIADVVGTLFTTPSSKVPTGVLPRTHAMVAIASFPKTTPTSDASSDLDLVMQKGCTINRFSATNPPHADGDAGNITIAGYNPLAIATNAKTFSSAAVPIPPITCTRSGPPLPLYSCFFGGMMGPDAGALGAKTDDVIFPIVPFNVVLNTPQPAPRPVIQNIPPSAGGWPFGDGLCIKRYVYNPQDPNAGTATCNAGNTMTCQTLIEVCEQSPILPLGVAQITESVVGGTDYPAVSQMLGNAGGLDGGTGQFPGPIFPVSVKSGTTEIVGTDPLTLGTSLSMAPGAIDPTKDLTITFSCDPNNASTAGAGCTGTADIAALLIKTSTSKKLAFSTTTASGVGQCIAKVPTGTITVKAAQLAAALGSQMNGSIQLALARVALVPKPAGMHLVAFTGGMGVFGFTDQ